ncbi:hypothetical protein TNCT1_38230 [Streptomyces sp. 1-11]|nr:hypothetical protein TNCT1_38230 [Streptomyces sp. 1-11]
MCSVPTCGGDGLVGGVGDSNLVPSTDAIGRTAAARFHRSRTRGSDCATARRPWPPCSSPPGGQGAPIPEIARKLVITSSKNQGKRPSVATVYRILTEGTDTTV